MQNVECAHLEKEVSHLLANGEIIDHHKLFPDSYLDTLHILFPASKSLWKVLPALTSLQVQPQPEKQRQAEGNSIYLQDIWQYVSQKNILESWSEGLPCP